ncbi:hypothetical protein BDV12DRAFT_167660 [Aspergillus spectabilis]
MSTQATFYLTDPSLDLSVAPESLLLGNGFSPGFLSLSLIENGIQHQDMAIPSRQFSLDKTGTVQAVAPNMQSEEGEDTCPTCFHKHALGPAPRDSCIDTEINQAPQFLHYYPFMSSFSGTADHDTEFSFNNDRISPHSDLSSNKSSSPLRWQNGDTKKRAKHLERNRVAATKSRQKKKRATDQLEIQFQEISRRRSGLEDDIRALHSQLLSLKDQILMHSRCDDDAIHRYLGRMVKQARKHDSVSSALTGKPDN